MQVADIMGMVVVGALWGCTNCFLRTGAAHTANTATEADANRRRNSSSNALGRGFRNLVNTLLNWRFTLPFALNQSGSLVYYFLLGSSELSLAVPACNALAVLFTGVTECILGERKPTVQWVCGILLVITGVFVMSLGTLPQDAIIEI